MPSETEKYEGEATPALVIKIFQEIPNMQRRNTTQSQTQERNYRNKKMRMKLTINHPPNIKQKSVLGILPIYIIGSNSFTESQLFIH